MKKNLFWLDVRGRTQYVTLKHKAGGSVVGVTLERSGKTLEAPGIKSGKAATVTEA